MRLFDEALGEATGREGGGEEPGVLGRIPAHVRERKTRAGLFPAGHVDLVGAFGNRMLERASLRPRDANGSSPQRENGL